jgi:hypothetical protein
LVVWDVKNYNHESRVYLIECIDDFTWDKLRLLYSQYNDQIYANYKFRVIIWLIGDSMVMKTKCDTTCGSDYKLKREKTVVVFITKQIIKLHLDYYCNCKD